MSTPFLSQIEIFSFNFAPKGWAQCNGQFLPINQNQALFSLLGTTYGGDGRTTFALPDLRGRVPIHFGNGFTLGQKGGEEAHTLTKSEMPAHTHNMSADSAAATTNTPAANLSLAKANASQNPGGAFNMSIYSGQGVANTLSTQLVSNTGGSQPHLNQMPSLVLNMCIALQGIFPSQN